MNTLEVIGIKNHPDIGSAGELLEEIGVVPFTDEATLPFLPYDNDAEAVSYAMGSQLGNPGKIDGIEYKLFVGWGKDGAHYVALCPALTMDDADKESREKVFADAKEGIKKYANVDIYEEA